jgi:hypothetical protein
MFDAQDIQKFLPYILVNVLNILQPVNNENEYAMKGTREEFRYIALLTGYFLSQFNRLSFF